MPIHHLEKLLSPESIAVIGASDEPSSVGYSVLKNLLAGASRRAVYAVNPRHGTVQGLPAVPNVRSLPCVPDLAVVCTPAAVVPQVVRECGQAGVGGVLVISAGFGETGEAGRLLDADLRAALAEFPAMRMIGPNCLGLVVPRLDLNASFAGSLPADGRVAFLSQSGALCTAILDWAEDRGIGFSHFVSVGNMLDVGFSDLIDYLADDLQTTAVLLYVESIPDARKFLSAARACTRTMPIIACKAGRSQAGSQAVLSHTGRMAGEEAVFDAALARAGIVRVNELEDLFDCAEILSCSRRPSGPNLAIVTNAGGPGILAADALGAGHGSLARLTAETRAGLNACLPSQWSHGNPVDVLGDASPERYGEALKLVLADPGVDAALVLLTPQAMTDATETARIVADVAKTTQKAVLTSWMGGPKVREGRTLLGEEDLPSYDTPEKAIRAFLWMVSYRQRQEILYETPRASEDFTPNRARKDEILFSARKNQDRVLSSSQCEGLLSAYGIPIARSLVARSEDEAVAAARQLGGPVAMKVLSPQISHKTDAGGVRFSLQDEAAVRNAYRTILDSVAMRCPQASVEGVTLQPMLPGGGVELILGARRDSAFGSVLMVGAGGITAECLHDVVLELPPLNERLASRMLEGLRIAPLLHGWRGRSGVDLDRLVDLIVRFSWLIAESPELREFEINPLRASGADFRAVDARGLLEDPALLPKRPFEHLAIRPYPQEFCGSATLRDGTAVTLRPIRPEDEPFWHELLAVCSVESIRSRFGMLFRNMTHEAAARFCVPDYDRELPLVAELQDGPRKRLIGLGQLVADPDHETAEFAVLIGDPWQEQGLGLALLEFCLKVARPWGVRSVTAVTDLTNTRMLSAFRELGFEFDQNRMGRQVRATRPV